MHIWPFDYYGDQAQDDIGLARTATLISQARDEAANSLLLDNGDFLQGNPMGDYYAFERGLRDGDVHPIMTAMNTLGIEATTLGNHEFNYGLGFLEKALTGADFPVVSSNVVKERGADPLRDATLVAPYVLLKRRLTDGIGQAHDITIGVIGFVPPQVMDWDRRHLEGNVSARDILESARAYVPQMLEQGADIIVALSHSGIGEARASEGMENASIPLAEIDGIDALLTGHSHLVFPSPLFEGMPAVDAVGGFLHGKPAVMGGFWGSRIGIIDLTLIREAGVWRISRSQVETRAVDSKTPSQTQILNVTEHAHHDTLAYTRRAVGACNVALHSYFARISDGPALQLVSKAQAWFVRAQLQDTAFEGLPLLSAVAPFKAGGRGGPANFTFVPAGDLAIKNVADLYIYPNLIRAVKVTGAQLRGWLERAAGMFNQILPGQEPQALMNPAFTSHDFDVIHGVRYEIDLAQPPRFEPNGALLNPSARRIRTLTYQGEHVADGAEFVVATNSYRADGAGGFPGLDGSNIVLESTETNRDVLLRYIQNRKTIEIDDQAAWCFAPMPGTDVLFQSSPKAVPFLQDLKPLNVVHLGQAENGFANFKLSL